MLIPLCLFVWSFGCDDSEDNDAAGERAYCPDPRMAAHAGCEDEAEGDFKSKIFDLPMNCYGAGLPLGACGEILMTVELRKL